MHLHNTDMCAPVAARGLIQFGRERLRVSLEHLHQRQRVHGACVYVLYIYMNTFMHMFIYAHGPPPQTLDGLILKMD